MRKAVKLRWGTLLVSLIFLMPACERAEERIIGTWQITHCYLNGTEVDSTAYHANNVRNLYFIYADHVMSVNTSYNGQIRQSTSGFWDITCRNKKLSFDFTLLGRKYSYVADIEKLTRRELFYEYNDDDGNHWRLMMNLRTF